MKAPLPREMQDEVQAQTPVVSAPSSSADALASPPLPPLSQLRGFEQKREEKSPGACISISTELAPESSKGAYDVLGVKYWVCRNKGSGINLVAWFGQNWVQQRATHTDHSESHPAAIPHRDSSLGSAVNRWVKGMKTTFSLKPF